MSSIKIDVELNAKGMNCPLPIIRAHSLLNKMKHGEVLKIEATDPGAIPDFEAYTNQTGHILHDSITADQGLFVFVIECRRQ